MITARFILGFCECGCGTEIPIRRKNGYLMRYRFHHSSTIYHKGSRHPQWKNGRVLTGQQGYIRLYKPDSTKRNKHDLEHKIIMERHIGRPLKSNEVVHHINHDRADNRIENLQLMTRSEHMKLHRKEYLESKK